MISASQVESIENLKRSAIRFIESRGLGRAESEDLFQQAVLKALTTQSENSEPEKITSWFYQILRNTLIDEFRKRKHLDEKHDEYLSQLQLDPPQELDEKICACVNAIMQDLPKADREILESHFFDGKKFKELAEIYHQTEGSIRVKAQRSRDKLKEMLKSCCNITRLSEMSDCECS